MARLYSSESTTYPLLGVGAFFILFWVGFVLGDLLGWACNALLVLGILLASIGSYCFARADALQNARAAKEKADQAQRTESDLLDTLSGETRAPGNPGMSPG